MIRFRATTPQDAPAIATLLDELGYPTEATRVDARLAPLLADPASAVFAAEADGQLIGLATSQVVPLIERDAPTCRLTALVVATTWRGRGVGRALVERVEADALQRGCDRVEVTTSDRRHDAHSFYRQLGFRDTPRRYLKPLLRGPDARSPRSGYSQPG